MTECSLTRRVLYTQTVARMATCLRILVGATSQEFALTEPLSSSVREVKQKLSRLLNTPESWLQLRWGSFPLADDQMLEELGAVAEGSLQVQLSILEPEEERVRVSGGPQEQEETFDTFLANQPRNPRPRLIYEPEDDLVDKDETVGTMGRYKKKNQERRIEVGGRSIRVEIDYFFGEKPYLGGWRHKKTRKEYHNAATQTDNAAKAEKQAKELRSRQVQTRPEVDQELQTTSEKGTQVARLGLYVLKEDDRNLEYSGTYTTADQLSNRYLFQVMFVQRVCRGWIARKKVNQMREVYGRQKDQEAEEKKQKAEEQYQRKMEEADRCENPKTKADFDMLYNKLEEWRRKEEDGLEERDGRALNVARAKLVMQEATMLSKISQNKNLANLEGKERAVRDFLERASSPHCWALSGGGTIRIETPDTKRALELRNLYIRLKCDDMIPEERVLVLVDLKENISQWGCRLTKELGELIKRETDMMERGVKHSNLGGLRQRILHLYLQYVRTPRYNPEARRYLRLVLPDPPPARKGAQEGGRRDIEYCHACSKFLPRSSFNMSAGSASLAQCQACRRLDNDARTRLDLSLYKSLLDSIKAEEEARNNLASPAFILQESDIRYIVENIWNSRSVLSGLGDLFDLRLARWECEKEWSPWNCILLAREECRIHTKLGGMHSTYPTKEDLVKAYGPLLVENIVSKHTLAKNHFANMASMSKFFDELEERETGGRGLALRGQGLQGRPRTAA